MKQKRGGELNVLMLMIDRFYGLEKNTLSASSCDLTVQKQ